MSKILVLDIGGSSIKYADFTLGGELIENSSFAVPETFNDLIGKITELFNSDDYKAISISSPGSVNTITGQGYGISAIDYIPSGGNLKATLEEKLNVPVAIENDANCAGLSEVHFNSKLSSIAYIVLGSGVGGCMVIDGKVVTGSTYFGGEFGYMPYKNSTFSRYAGMVGLSANATGNGEVIPGTEIFIRYDNGDEMAIQAVDEYYTAIASLIAILKYTQNPQAVIFAGAVTNRQSFISEVQYAIDKITNNDTDTDLSDVQIQVGQFGSAANLYGAYANLVRNYDV